MQPRHGFRHSNETDQNEPKHQYWFQKKWIGCVRFVSGPNRCIVLFLPDSVHRFVSARLGALCNPDMVFGTVTKLTKMNPNINIGSKKMEFISSPNRCIVSFLPDSVH